ncbi:winged helix-turn-helix domain-containing protein, partial [Salmonella enterica]
PRLLTRQYLEEHLSTWQQDISSNIIQVHISNLRRKLGDKIIQTVHGQGYRLMELNNKNQHLF